MARADALIGVKEGVVDTTLSLSAGRFCDVCLLAALPTVGGSAYWVKVRALLAAAVYVSTPLIWAERFQEFMDNLVQREFFSLC